MCIRILASMCCIFQVFFCVEAGTASDVSSEWRTLRYEELKGTPDYEIRGNAKDHFLAADGDFDGDGLTDHAELVAHATKPIWAIRIQLSSQQQPVILEESTFAAISRTGLSSAPPRTYARACAKGYGPACGPSDPRKITLQHEALAVFTIESGGGIFVWRDGSFEKVWISD